MKELDFLHITLHEQTVGYLVSLSQGQNRLYFDPNYLCNKDRTTFSLTTHPNFPNHTELLNTVWVRWQRLHPVLSNLLPEGALRESLAQSLKIHIDHEFLLFKYLGMDLPGAIVATPIAMDKIPAFVLKHLDVANKMNEIPIKDKQNLLNTLSKQSTVRPFSLAGVQTKFSMRQILTKSGQRFTLPLSSQNERFGDWIVKTPSHNYPFVPENEYSMMKLAELAKISIPAIQLVPLDALMDIEDKTLYQDVSNPNDKLYAYAIKRFDRQTLPDGGIGRIHSEDFAQILVKYPHEKYHGGNYAQIAKILYRFSENGLADVNQLARRILINILIANGDAHLKNWSVVYQDGINPSLSPAYDLVSTKVYLPNETSFSLNLDTTKDWHKVTLTHFEHWAKKADIPWRSVKPQLLEVVQIARDTWQDALDELPMAEQHKRELIKHWSMLGDDFRIG